MKSITTTKKFLSLVLTLFITISLFLPTQVFAATYDTSKYDKNDVQIINALIKSTDFYLINIDEPASWEGFITWTTSTPKKVAAISVSTICLSGNFDVRGLTALTDLDCSNQSLTKLDVSGCTALKNIKCDRNQLTSLNIKGCTALTTLYCDINQLTTLDISGLTSLNDITCTLNRITSKSSILGLAEAPQYMHLSYIPQSVDVVLPAPAPTTAPSGVTLSVFGQNESPTISNAALIKKDGSVWAWGTPLYGNEKGSPDYTPHFTDNPLFADRLATPPQKILDDAVAVSSGYNHSAAIKKDGSLWAWGASTKAPPLGDQYGDPSDTPIKIMDDVACVSTGTMYTMAVKKDGSLWGWGDNAFGQLGDGTGFNTRTTPVKIMDDVASVSAGTGDDAIQTMIIKKDGSLWGCGTHDLVGVDDGEVDNVTQPVKVMDDVASVSAGAWYTMAIKKDGSLWGWGSNAVGQLGVKTEIAEGESSENAQSITPIKIMDNVVFASAGRGSSLAIKTDGSLWGWGDNGGGQLGDDIPLTVGVLPTKIMDNVASVMAGSMVLKTDGTLIGLGTDGEAPIKLTDGVMLPNIAQLAPTSPSTTPATTFTATPTASKVLVNGTNISFDAYTINGSNYFKLRDLAKVISGTGKQFEVTWDGTKNAINLVSGKSYTPVGGELAAGDGKVKTPKLSTSKIYIDGSAVALTAYEIGGNNYFKLRDVMKVFNIGVGWDDATSTITIDTSIGYTP